MTDPIIEAARGALADGFDTLRRAAEGLPAEALNWRPAGDETNSIAVLTTHAAHATRLLLHLVAALPLPPRDRPAEFVATADGPGPLLHLVDTLGAECLAVLDSVGEVEWAGRRQRGRDGGEIVEMSAAGALIKAVTHLRGHADEAALTRHMWLARS